MRQIKKILFNFAGFLYGLSIMFITIFMVILDYNCSSLTTKQSDTLHVLFYITAGSFCAITFLVFRMIFSETLIENQEEINEIKESYQEAKDRYIKAREKLETQLLNNDKL